MVVDFVTPLRGQRNVCTGACAPAAERLRPAKPPAPPHYHSTHTLPASALTHTHTHPPFNRVGRTGRAGAKGTAITFIGPDEERYAPDLVKALRESGAPIPQDLQVGAGRWAVL